MDNKFNKDLILDTACIGIIAADMKNRITFINKYATKLLALDEKHALGSYVSDVLPSATPFLKKCMESGESQLGYKLKEGKNKILGNISPIRVGTGIAGTVCCLFGSKEIEPTVRELESYQLLIKELDAVFKYSSFGSWVSDGEGTVLKVNKVAEEHVGIKAKDIVGKKAWYLLEKGFVNQSATGKVVKTKSRVSFVQHVKKTNKDLLVQATPVFDYEGKLSKIISNTRDITRLNAIKKDLEHSRSVTEKFKDELYIRSMLELKNKEIIAESRHMKQILSTAIKLAKLEASEILILGESGVGKGLLAKFIHNNSLRKKQPFTQINCAALPENLLEAELFGYEKGAFTGASDKGKIGLIELSQNGSLFLDEIGDIPLSIQAKLLTYLDDHVVRPLGSVYEKTINCTIIATTNKDLPLMIRQGHFREDLFFRLNTFTVRIPPLRERPEDIFQLVNLFLQKYNDEYNQHRRISSRSIKTLCGYSFPGNVREVENIVKQAVVMSESDVIDDFIIHTIGAECYSLNMPVSYGGNLFDKIRNFEKEQLKDALRHGKTTREMAKYLGISQSAVVKKLKKHRLQGPLIRKGIT